MKTDDDFGFTHASEDELFSERKVDDKAQKLRDMIMPLLNNLKANPEKDIIKWNGADRVKRIDEFIDRMNSLIND